MKRSKHDLRWWQWWRSRSLAHQTANQQHYIVLPRLLFRCFVTVYFVFFLYLHSSRFLCAAFLLAFSNLRAPTAWNEWKQKYLVCVVCMCVFFFLISFSLGFFSLFASSSSLTSSLRFISPLWAVFSWKILIYLSTVSATVYSIETKRMNDRIVCMANSTAVRAIHKVLNESGIRVCATTSEKKESFFFFSMRKSLLCSLYVPLLLFFFFLLFRFCVECAAARTHTHKTHRSCFE